VDDVDGGCDGPLRPSDEGLARGGICGAVARAAVREDVAAVVLTAGSLAWAALAPSDRPGAIAETSPAAPAVSAAVPASTQRRVRTMRASAASRSITARGRSLPGSSFIAKVVA
jgi:hypothetical protein